MQCGIASPNQAIGYIFNGEWESINHRFEAMPDLHAFARQAIASTDCHFGPGSTQMELVEPKKASWAFVITGEKQADGQPRFDRMGFAGGLMNEQLPECHVNALNAEATALIGVAEFLLSQPQLSEWDVCCHFDALSVGQGTFGWSNCCTVERENGVRQTAARILMSMVQRRIGKIQGHHTHAHVGQLWNEMADSIAGAICDGWTAPTPAELKATCSSATA